MTTTLTTTDPAIWVLGLLIVVLMAVTGFLLRAWFNRIETSIQQLSSSIREGHRHAHRRMDEIEARTAKIYQTKDVCKVIRDAQTQAGSPS